MGSGVFSHKDYEIEESGFYMFDLYDCQYDRGTGAYNIFLIEANMALAGVIGEINKQQTWADL